MTKKKARSVDPTAHVYCDESGNSGPNLLDRAQPVYVLGGWLVPTQFVSQAEAVVEDLSRALRITAGEVHGVTVLRSRKGQEALDGFMSAMGKAGAIPVYDISEKRYWIAGKVVETYLDSFYNHEVPWEFYNDILAKQELADEISEFPDEYLHEFAAAYRSADEEALKRSALPFATLFELKQKLRLASWFRSSIRNLAEVAEAERKVTASLPARALGTVNLPVLASFFSLVESLARHYRMEDVEIFHDESKEFGPAYEWAFDLHKRAKPGMEIHLPNGRMMGFSFERVKSITMVRSRDSLLVQAADLLVHALARYAKCIAMAEQPAEWLVKALDETIAAAVLPAYFAEVGTFGHLTGRPAFLRGMFVHLPSWKANGGKA